MLCPKCGTENGVGAKFCKGCGTALAQSDVVQPQGTPESEQAKGETPKPEDAKVKDAGGVEVKSTEVKPAEVKTVEVATDGAAKGADVKAKLASMPKKTKLIIGGFAAVAVIAIVAAVLLMNNGPSDSTIEEFVRQSGVEQSIGTSDTWADKSSYTIQSVKVLEKTKNNGGTQSAIVMGVQMSDPYTAKVEAVLSNGSTEVTEQATMYLAKVNGEWDPLFFSKSSFSVASVKLTKGVSHKKVTKNMGSILSEAYKSGKPSLSTVYQNGTFKVVDEKLDSDAKTDKLTIECVAETDYSEAKGKIVATFAFGDSGWSLKSAKGDDDLYKVSFQKLVGSWKGSLDDQSSSSKKCFGGKATPAKLTITSVDEKSGKVEGTLTSLMHFHQTIKADEDSDAGDAVISDIPFSIDLDLDGDVYIPTDSFEYERDNDSSADIFISLDTKGLKVTVMSSYEGGSGLFNWSSFQDEYIMTKDN